MTKDFFITFFFQALIASNDKLNTMSSKKQKKKKIL